jgi:type I restriction enzyme R subunit
MMNLNLDASSLNEFGRFDKLKNSVNFERAKLFLETKTNESLSASKTFMRIEQFLSNFILSGGFDLNE